MKKLYLISVFCILLGCDDSYSAFKPNDECRADEPMQVKEGAYYYCHIENGVGQWRPFGREPVCDPNSLENTRFVEENNVCKKEVCSSDYVWVKDKENDADKEVSCKYSDSAQVELGDCLNGEFKCENDELSVCTGGEFTRIPMDSATCLCDDSDPCSNNGNIGVQCINGKKVACDQMVSCHEGKCGECRNGTERCAVGSNEPQICVDGVYRDCTDEDHCMIACHECGESEYRCNADHTGVEKCIDHIWTNDGLCGAGKACEAGVCKDTAAKDCKNGESVCIDENTVKECGEDGKWKTPSACGAGKACEAGVCKDTTAKDCKNGESVCIDENTVKECGEDGKWKTPTACGKGKTCNDGVCKDIAVNDCRVGESVCIDENTVKECGEDGKWKTPSACGNGKTCNAGACKDIAVNECELGEFVCSDKNTIKECGEDGKWKTPVTCGSGQECIDKENKHAKCIISECKGGQCEGQSRCRDGNIEYVVEDSWTTFSCGWGAECSGNAPTAKCVEVCESDGKAPAKYDNKQDGRYYEGEGYYYIEKNKDGDRFWACFNTKDKEGKSHDVRWGAMNKTHCSASLSYFESFWKQNSVSLESTDWTDIRELWLAINALWYVYLCQNSDKTGIVAKACVDDNRVHLAPLEIVGNSLNLNHSDDFCANGCFKGECIDKCEKPGVYQPVNDALIESGKPVKLEICSSEKLLKTVYCESYDEKTGKCD